MKTLFRTLLLVAIGLSMSACFAEKTYMGKVDVVGIGAGHKPTSSDANSINKSTLKNITVTYADKIKIEEQDVSKNTKYVVGEALTKEFSGEPKFLVDYLNVHQSLDNKVIILDKNGVVAWSGRFSTADVTKANGAYDYGITGIDRMYFDDAMKKFVLDGDEAAEYDEDKKIIFTQDISSMFSNSGKHPLLFTKLPNIKVSNTDGLELNLSSLIKNGKPTVLVFYMSQAAKRDLIKDVGNAINVVNMFSGVDSNTETLRPQRVLQSIQEIYFVK